MGDISISNGNHINGNNIGVGVQRKSCWYEEEIEENLRWCFALKSILHTSASQYQDIQLLDTKPFGKEVVDFCKSHLVANKDAFCDPRLELVINDARAELERRDEVYDVIIGDLADPIEGGPCYKLYTKSFYESVVKPRLNQAGIFVTQAGPAGIFSHTEVFSCIYNTLRQVFKYVVPYSAHIPSYADTWGWVMASDSPLTLSADEFDLRIKQRIEGENRYVDGKTFSSASTLSKAVRKSLENETHIYTEGNARFIYGHGAAYKQH
ncbi:spermidine synthase [Striga asiatica]|uniref:Spermidine synthase n=1 Tax=Striga asiatica TaxID=4170 RepID=A0A5A7Q2V0_STRAF|nr:spermidine synthase [Striga asiatica]